MAGQSPTRVRNALRSWYTATGAPWWPIKTTPPARAQKLQSFGVIMQGMRQEQQVLDLGGGQMSYLGVSDVRQRNSTLLNLHPVTKYCTLHPSRIDAQTSRVGLKKRISSVCPDCVVDDGIMCQCREAWTCGACQGSIRTLIRCPRCRKPYCNNGYCRYITTAENANALVYATIVSCKRLYGGRSTGITARICTAAL
ncbi:hypothetical protein F5I97DRAFT_1832463 [Phlebopus sp. FC_14]|nr:hypothetical protein F5I97DRAFT_1832463 [Phlebopus sp. FC_14]